MHVDVLTKLFKIDLMSIKGFREGIGAILLKHLADVVGSSGTKTDFFILSTKRFNGFPRKIEVATGVGKAVKHSSSYIKILDKIISQKCRKINSEAIFL